MAHAPGAKTVDEAVRQIVEALLHNVQCPPTDLDQLMALLGVDEIVSEDLPISGMLRRVGKSLTVVYSKHLPKKVRRFTIAHEFGHAVFEQTGPNCPRKGEELERLCDKIAAEILMPTDVFRAHIKDQLTLKNVFELANLFDTSIASTLIRVEELVSDVVVFELDGPEIRWKRGLRRLPANVLRTVRDANERDAKTTIYLEGRGELVLEWSTLGGERKVCLLSNPGPGAKLSPNRLSREEIRRQFRALSFSA